MALFEWTQEYSVSVVCFDTEHKKLFSLINELNEAMAEKRGRFVVARVLQELADYARWHFAGEESAMRRANFAGLGQHVMEHQEFSAKVEKFYAECDDSYSTVPIEVLYFLRDWLLKHVLIADRLYAEPLNRTGIH